MQPRQSSAGARLTGRDLVGKWLGELYDFNRGALYANSLLQARAAFDTGDFVKALELVKASAELFEKRHKKTTEQDPARPDGKRRASKQQRLALEGKQARIKEILGIFDEALRHLEKMAKFQRLGRPPPAAASAPSPGARPVDALPMGFRAEYQAAGTPDARDRVVCRHFQLEPVRSDQDLRPDTLYYVRGRQGHLIRSDSSASHANPVGMTVVLSGQRMKPIARHKLLELGNKSQLVKLVPKAAGQAAPASGGAKAEEGAVADGEETASLPQKSHAECVIDMGTFTQLLTAAQQSGIVANADQIAHVRDREFRMGKHQTAFAIIERLSVKFGQTAGQREQKLRREEIDYKSGRLKMSPKQWQLKKQRDTLQTQKIERARRHFARVLDGLRILVVSR